MNHQSFHSARRRFLTFTTTAGAVLLAVPRAFAQMPAPAPMQATPQAQPPAQPPRQRPPRIDPALVEEFVRAGHANLPRTQELLALEPGLLNATWDWGGGDWETALGGAGHMGNREIAGFLLAKGARMDIFVAAMLGRLDVVEAVAAAIPEALQSRGPHGITLLSHAKKGGDNAVAVVEFLAARGITS